MPRRLALAGADVLALPVNWPLIARPDGRASAGDDPGDGRRTVFAAGDRHRRPVGVERGVDLDRRHRRHRRGRLGRRAPRRSGRRRRHADPARIPATNRCRRTTTCSPIADRSCTERRMPRHPSLSYRARSPRVLAHLRQQRALGELGQAPASPATGRRPLAGRARSCRRSGSAKGVTSIPGGNDSRLRDRARHDRVGRARWRRGSARSRRARPRWRGRSSAPRGGLARAAAAGSGRSIRRTRRRARAWRARPRRCSPARRAAIARGRRIQHLVAEQRLDPQARLFDRQHQQSGLDLAARRWIRRRARSSGRRVAP